MAKLKKKKKTRKQLQLRCKIQQKRRVFDDFSTTGRAKVVTLLDYRRKKNYSDTECCDKVKKYEMFCHLRYLIKNSSQIPDKGRQRNMKNPEGGEKCDCLPTHTWRTFMALLKGEARDCSQKVSS